MTEKGSSRPLREVLLVWGGVLLLLVAFRLLVEPWIWGGGSVTGALAVALFLWAPSLADKRAGRPWSDQGLNLRHWKADLGFSFLVMAVVFPLFCAAFLLLLAAADGHFPLPWLEVLTPYSVASGGFLQRFSWRLPERFLDLLAGNIAVAIAEEVFYRGYMLRRLLTRWPSPSRGIGAMFSKALWLQALLFALGHLLIPAPFRLATFFPGLLFGWMALRSGRIGAAIVVHAASNLLVATLEASAFGP